MDFTREPIVETIITPKEGCKLVVRSSKGVVQEEYFVDSVQVVSFGNAFFFRSIERPKAFLVPVADYEILEVREARMVLKNVGVERTIKIGGGRDGSVRTGREGREPVQERIPASDEATKVAAVTAAEGQPAEKKRERRRGGRRRRGRDERPAETGTAAEQGEVAGLTEEKRDMSTLLTSILPPPSQLISETLQQYRGSELFKDIFNRPSETTVEESSEVTTPPLPPEEPPQEDHQD